MEAQAEFRPELQRVFVLTQTATSVAETGEVAQHVITDVADLYSVEISQKRQDALIQDALIWLYAQFKTGSVVTLIELKEKLHERLGKTCLKEISVKRSAEQLRKGPSLDEQRIHHLEFEQSLAELKEDREMQATVLKQAQKCLKEAMSPEDLMPDTQAIQDLTTNFITWFVNTDERFDDVHKSIVLAMLYLDTDIDGIWAKYEYMQIKDKKTYTSSKESLEAKFKQVMKILEVEGELLMQEFVRTFNPKKTPITPQPVVSRTYMHNFLDYWDIQTLKHGNEAALERVVQNYTPLIKSIINRMLIVRHKDESADKENIVQATVAKLTGKFAMADPNKGRIDTYIGYHIRSIVTRLIHSDEDVRKPEQFHAILSLLQQNEHLPKNEKMSDEEVAECAHSSVSLVQEARTMREGGYIELNKPVGNDFTGDTIGDLLLIDEIPESPESAAINENRAQLARKIYAALPEEAQNVVRRYFFQNMTMQEVADEMGVTRARVEQVINKDILARLRGNKSLIQSKSVLFLDDEEGFRHWLSDNNFSYEEQQWIFLYLGFEPGTTRRYNNASQVEKFLTSTDLYAPDKSEIAEVLKRFAQLQKEDKKGAQELDAFIKTGTITQSFKEAAILCKKIREELYIPKIDPTNNK